MEHISERAKERKGLEHKLEGKIERFATALPSATWIGLAGGAVLSALVLRVARKKSAAIFVGEWVPTLLMLGLYTKVAKVAREKREAHI
ncbi:MAG TPA: hypothetical protein VN253_13245 [Kofleriaceae bacterium]|nr:hypothetical protein [Kofleriaceae bacterium]